MSRLFGRIVLQVFVSFTLMFFLAVTLYSLKQPINDGIIFLVGIIYFIFASLRCVFQVFTSVKIDEHTLNITTIGKQPVVYEKQSIQVELKVSNWRMYGAPVYGRYILIIKELEGRIIAKHNLSGLSAKDIPVLMNQFEKKQSTSKKHLEQLSNQQFEPMIYQVGIDARAANAGLRNVMLILFIGLLLFAGIDYMNPDNESMYVLMLMMAGFFFIIWLLLALQKSPHVYPKQIGVSKEGLIINQQVILASDIERVFYTPVKSERVMLTLMIQLVSGKQVRFLLGKQYVANKQERSKFNQYPEFIQTLKSYFKDRQGVLIEDANHAYTVVTK